MPSSPRTAVGFEAWNETAARAIAARFAKMPGGLIPALHAMQSAFGFVPQPSIAILADAFNLSRAEVHGVAHFYHDFRHDGPPGRRVLKLCRAEACQAVGSGALADMVRRRLKVNWGETGVDGEWTLEQTFCLGLCACGPAAMLDGRPLARLDEEKLAALLDGAR